MNFKLPTLFVVALLLLHTLQLSAQFSVGGKPYLVDTLTSVQVGPSSFFSRYHFTHPTAPLLISLLEVDLTDPYVRMATVMSADSISGSERPSLMAQRKSSPGNLYFGGTNGDFYATAGAVGTPVNGQMVAGEVTRIPHLSRPLIAFDAFNKPIQGLVRFTGSVTTSRGSHPILRTNDSRGGDELILFNRFHGKGTRTNSFGTEVLVELSETVWGVNSPLKAKVVAIEMGVGNMALTAGRAVLSGHGIAAQFLGELLPGDEVTLQLSLMDETSQSLGSIFEMIGGDRFILEGGELSNTDWAELHPRTAIGFSADRGKLYLMVVDGRSSLSVGCTTRQLGELIRYAGAAYALNLDGGGSSALYVDHLGVTNNPSDTNERAVANGIFAVATSPDDQVVTKIAPKSFKFQLPRFGLLRPTFYGYNQYGVLVDSNLQGVTLSTSPEQGYIINENQFVATSPNSGSIQAAYNGITLDMPYELINEAVIAIRMDSVILDAYTSYPIEVISLIRESEVPLLPKALSWEVRDCAICMVDEGVLTPLSNGSTWVIGHLGDFVDSLYVKVETPDSRSFAQEQFELPSSWFISASSNLQGINLDAAHRHHSWQTGAGLNYRYTVGRSPSIRLSKEISFYSLPDSIRMTIHTGDVDISKAILSLKSATSTVGTPFTFDALPKNSEQKLTVATRDLEATRDDLKSFPIKFDYLTLYLNTATQQLNSEYTIGLKEISLIYDNIELSTSSPSLASQLRIYPNPATTGSVTLKLNHQTSAKTTIRLINLVGHTLANYTLDNRVIDEFDLPLNGVAPGTYFIHLCYDQMCEVAKLQVR